MVFFLMLCFCILNITIIVFLIFIYSLHTTYCMVFVNIDIYKVVWDYKNTMNNEIKYYGL